MERFGRIDVWVNNASITAFDPFEEVAGLSAQRARLTGL